MNEAEKLTRLMQRREFHLKRAMTRAEKTKFIKQYCNRRIVWFEKVKP